LTNYQFGRGTIKTAAGDLTPTVEPMEVAHSGNGNGNGNGHDHEEANGFTSLADLARSGVTPSAFSARRVEDASFGEDESHDPSEPEQAAPAARGMNTPKTTEQKLEEFYGVKQDGDEVLFSAQFQEASKVMIAGDFNNWKPISTPMRKAGNGTWQTRLPLPHGRYRYRLVVDGKWMTDPNNTYVETNQFGELNNVVEVE
jgi:hypothetical protein